MKYDKRKDNTTRSLMGIVGQCQAPDHYAVLMPGILNELLVSLSRRGSAQSI